MEDVVGLHRCCSKVGDVFLQVSSLSVAHQSADIVDFNCIFSRTHRSNKISESDFKNGLKALQLRYNVGDRKSSAETWCSFHFLTSNDAVVPPSTKGALKSKN